MKMSLRNANEPNIAPQSHGEAVYRSTRSLFLEKERLVSGCMTARKAERQAGRHGRKGGRAQEVGDKGKQVKGVEGVPLEDKQRVSRRYTAGSVF